MIAYLLRDIKERDLLVEFPFNRGSRSEEDERRRRIDEEDLMNFSGFKERCFR